MDESVEGVYDFTFVNAVARIALYDDLRSAPRITEIQPAPTDAFIETLASTIYDQARGSGGAIPYTVIREVSENFIHAQFAEMVVTILDRGNTIRFADQGPGIPNKDKAQLPGFSSAREPMKQYIRGVGSGLPIVKEYLEFSHGSITIEDNLGCGSVVTLSLNAENASASGNFAQQPFAQPQAAHAAFVPQPAWAQQSPAQGFTPMEQGAYAPMGTQAADPFQQAAPYGTQAAFSQAGAGVSPAMNTAVMQPAYPQAGPGACSPTQADPGAYAAAGAMANPAAGLSGLSEREITYLTLFKEEGELGVTEIANLTGNSNSTIHSTLTKMEQAGLVEKTPRKKRCLTAYGLSAAEAL